MYLPLDGILHRRIGRKIQQLRIFQQLFYKSNGAGIIVAVGNAFVQRNADGQHLMELKMRGGTFVA